MEGGISTERSAYYWSLKINYISCEEALMKLGKIDFSAKEVLCAKNLIHTHIPKTHTYTHTNTMDFCTMLL